MTSIILYFLLNLVSGPATTQATTHTQQIQPPSAGGDGGYTDR